MKLILKNEMQKAAASKAIDELQALAMELMYCDVDKSRCHDTGQECRQGSQQG